MIKNDMGQFFKDNLIYCLLILAGLFCFWGSLIYWAHALTLPGMILNLALSLGSFIIILRSLARNQNPEDIRTPSVSGTDLFAAAIYLLFWGWGLYILFLSGTEESIISPWNEVPGLFFLVFFLASALLFGLILKKRHKVKPLIHLHAFLIFSVAALVYKIGYGFDPFIHEATMDLINETGAVTPKPLYYVGQYSLVITLYKILPFSLITLNKFLVPVLAALFLPEALLRGLRSKWGEKNALLIVFFLPMLTFSPFVVTIPQNLSYVFLISVVGLGLAAKNRTDMAVIGLLALATFFVHPVSGIPALLFFINLVIFKAKKERILRIPKNIYYAGIFSASALSLPIAFALGAQAEPTLNSWRNILPDMNNLVPGREDVILNFIYLYNNWIQIILIPIVAAGIFIFYRQKGTSRHIVYLNIGTALVLSYILSRLFLNFDFLIDYEQNNYFQRILILALIFFFPFITTVFQKAMSRIRLSEIPIKAPMTVFVLLLLPVSLYLSYPRHDHYHNSHFFSVGSSDLEAVEWIEEDADKDYVVLANQQVSVAALRKFGFDRYYKNDIYFYPIPTGGELYKHYLDMVYERPTRETMIEAMEIAGVDKGYFVLNKYWWGFDKLKQEAKLEADSWEEIKKGNILVFEYNK